MYNDNEISSRISLDVPVYSKTANVALFAPVQPTSEREHAFLKRFRLSVSARAPPATGQSTEKSSKISSASVGFLSHLIPKLLKKSADNSKFIIRPLSHIIF